MSALGGDRETAATGVVRVFTVTAAVPCFPSDVAVISADPTRIPVTTPTSVTFATDGADELQDIWRPVIVRLAESLRIT
jgi:hypothetical protein